jgi:voltage-gated sodium channel
MAHVHGGVFDRIVSAAIFANTAVLLCSLFDETHRELLERVDLALLWFFAAEIGLRFKHAGRRCWRDRWLLFDTLVIAVTIAPIGVNVSALRVVRTARITHHVRHASHLRGLDPVWWTQGQAAFAV